LRQFGPLRWWPDSASFVAGGTDLKGRAGVFRIDAHSGLATPVFFSSEGDAVPSMTAISPDGASLYYRHVTSSAVRIVAREVTSGTERVLWRQARAPGEAPSVLVGLSLSPDGAGPASPALLAVLIGGSGWMTTARLVRQETLRLLASEHLRAAHALGLPLRRILRVHLLPGLAPTLVAAGTVALAAAIPLEAALSYLGLGVHLPQASWGNIVSEAEGQLLRRWWLVLFPTLAIVSSVLALNVAAERLLPRQDARDR
jgi:hypothetical protein